MSLQRFWLCPLLLAFLIVAAVEARSARAEDASDEQGFESLFDGKTLKGWRGYKSAKAPSGWEVEKGSLVRKGKRGDLMTDQKFGDFDLRLEWKISPGGNSGIMYRVAETQDKAHMTGIEYQVLDNDKHHDGHSPLTRAASLYGLYAPDGAETKPVGKYNTTRIVVKGKHVEHWLNGKKVVDTEIGTDEWNKKVAGSKFAAWEQYAKMPEGHIVLQDHGNQVWFRNIRIKKL